MKILTRAVVGIVLAGGITGTAMAGPAFGSAPANENGTSCHGAWLSYLATSDMAPGQLHRDFGVSVQSVQDTADAMCLP